jgi:hypothetical protein
LNLEFVLPQGPLNIVAVPEVLDQLRVVCEPGGGLTVDLSAYQVPACYCDLGTIHGDDNTDIEIDEEVELDKRDAGGYSSVPERLLRKWPHIDGFTARIIDERNDTFLSQRFDSFEQAQGWCEGIHRMVAVELMPRRPAYSPPLSRVTISAEDGADGGLYCLYFPVEDPILD